MEGRYSIKVITSVSLKLCLAKLEVKLKKKTYISDNFLDNLYIVCK